MKSFKELFESTKPFYIVILDEKPSSKELKEFKKAGSFKVNNNELETTDKKVFNKLKEIADKNNIPYTPYVELMKI